MIQEYTIHFFIEKQAIDMFEFRKEYGEIESMLKCQQILKEEVRNGNNVTLFDFVGIVNYSGKIICVFPKYVRLIGREKTEKHIATVLEVINQYSKEQDKDADSIFGEVNKNFFDIFPTVHYLLNDYVERGYYQWYVEENLMGLEGEINFQETMENEIAYMSNESPVYLNYYSRQEVEDNYHMILKVHKWAVKECIERFAVILGYTDMNFSYDDSGSIEDLGEKEYVLECLDKQINMTFMDMDSQLLYTLKSFLFSWYEQSSEKTYVYGTNKFEHIWRGVCRTLLTGNVSENMPLNVWKLYERKLAIRDEEDTLKPDIMYECDLFDKEQKNSGLDENLERVMLIADIKYCALHYNLERKRIEGYPKIEEVSKQMLYEMSLRRRNSLKEIKEYFNMMLFPTNGKGDFAIIGEVDLLNGDDTRLFEFAPIQLVGINVDTVYRKYLKKESFSTEEMKKLLFMLKEERTISDK